MIDEITHIYCVPGMAANPSIFKNISLPSEKFKLHLLEWFVPNKNMSLEAYAKKMNEQIIHQNPVLLGVSFGGMLVQEMARFQPVKKVVVVSSVKSSQELPRRMRWAKYTGAHKILPTGLVNNVELMAKYAFGEKVNERLKLYEEYLSVRDKNYIDWSLDKIVNWRAKDFPAEMVHIHGEKDPVFPIKNIKNCIKVKNGTHTMIIHRAKWFNENLPTIILQ
ncbi:alpha/beta hydrolase [Cytophaga sp. FL35]|uniref:alpha/beta fold hydrolase n=1 Tax=Cytophaga sp. FL35 TaxID=1904456 RepID=UPI0016534285|nr:alpha/beta hydrolase [Cytophaga sp. FL35]MBC7000770.1 alpha/beta hydrolase [Cytophaga sp. FL35]